ncbi:MAG: NAD(P)-dependent oxidoreductase [Planctomycetota bacterium]|nr:NAD(P)-dependent oxidoreductase [Planctomycetota bacterium]
MPTNTPVAFLGLGLMGRPMAFHLLERGCKVAVWNRSAGKTAGFAEKGARVAESPADAAKGAKLVFTCVGDAPDVEEVLFHDLAGATTKADLGTLFVDHSTISPAKAHDLEVSLRDEGFRFLDAPISGGQKGAIAGQLAIMCGGAEADFAEAEPVMRAYGKNIVHVGGPGMGQVCKACNQVLVVANIMGVAEALNLAKNLGANPEKVLEAVKGGAAGSWSLENLGPKMIAGDDSAGFYVKHQQKDLRIVLEAAREAGLPLPGTALIHELYKIVQNRGGDEKGNHCLFRALEVMKGSDWRAE